MGSNLFKVRIKKAHSGKSGGFRTLIAYREGGILVKHRRIKVRDSIKEAIAETVQGMVDTGMTVSFSEKELKTLGVTIPAVELSADKVQEIRGKLNLSQSVFAKLLNVSTSSIQGWEQGKRNPSGSTKVLLELLEKSPHLLDHRLNTCGCHL